jgi:hypothetical protein
MDTLSLSIHQREHKFHLLEAPDVQRHDLTNWLLVRLALDGPVHVLVGGNRYSAYAIHRLARRCTSDLETVLSRIRVARAFTCYQVHALLSEACLQPPAPRLVLDLLDTFGDQNVPAWERARLLHGCIGRLQALAAQAPLLVSLRLPVPCAAEAWLAPLERAADCIWQLDPGPDPSVVVRPIAAGRAVLRSQNAASIKQLKLF